MEVTYQELVDAYSKSIEQGVNIIRLDIDNTQVELTQGNALDELLNSHEISSSAFEEYKSNYWFGHSPIYSGILDFKKTKKLIENRDESEDYIQIRFGDSKKGKDFEIGLRIGHIFHSKLSCYSIRVFSPLLNSASSINLFKGEKPVEGILQSFMMLECQINGEPKYYDLVENPDKRLINLTSYVVVDNEGEII